MKALKPVTNHDDKKRHVICPNAVQMMHNRLNGFVMLKSGRNLKKFIELADSTVPHVRLMRLFNIKERLMLNPHDSGVCIEFKETIVWNLFAYENDLFSMAFDGKTIVSAFTAKEFAEHYTEHLPEDMVKICRVALGLN